MRKPIPISLLFLPVLVLPAVAQAHAGHDHHAGFMAGLMHPFTGLDHLLGILAAGLLLGWLRGTLRWLTAAGFLAVSAAVHVLWTPAAADEGFLAGLLTITAALVAAGMAATSLLRFTAAGAR